MRILYLYCHPLADSFHAAIRSSVLNALKGSRHTVDLLDLYAESFEPALTADERRHYFESPRNQVGLEAYVERLKGAEILLVQFPTWCFGTPAMLKGFFDRLLIPGVAFDMSGEAGSKPSLDNLAQDRRGRHLWPALVGGVLDGRRAAQDGHALLALVHQRRRQDRILPVL